MTFLSSETSLVQLSSYGNINNKEGNNYLNGYSI